MMNQAMIIGKDGRAMRFTTIIMIKENVKAQHKDGRELCNIETREVPVSQYGVFQFMDTAYRCLDLRSKEISMNIGGEFTNP
ncbi:hypothetical protein Tco_0511640 [Tanacetum coccineum]